MRRLSAVLLGALLLVSCGGGEGASDGEPDGRELFESTVLGGQAGCVTCHSREPDRILVGPSVAGIGAVAADRVPGLSATEYLRQSILDPDAHLVEGFEAGRMPSVWGEVLSDAEIDALVAYLEGLRP